MKADRAEAAAKGAIEGAQSNPLLSALRALVLVPITVFVISSCVVSAFVARGLQRKFAAGARWTHRWYLWTATIMGFRVTHRGTIPPPGSLIAPNHIGYVDTVAIGYLLHCFFVAKADVAAWPVMGSFFRWPKQIGVPRSRSRGVAIASEEVAARLREKISVCVFLEGTSTGGGELRPFHGTLLQSAIDANAPIVPTAICWAVRSPGLSISEDVAYWKDHVFMRHFWRLLGLRGVSVDIRFGDPIDPRDANRKELAPIVRDRVMRLIAGEEPGA